MYIDVTCRDGPSIPRPLRAGSPNDTIIAATFSTPITGPASHQDTTGCAAEAR